MVTTEIVKYVSTRTARTLPRATRKLKTTPRRATDALPSFRRHQRLSGTD